MVHEYFNVAAFAQNAPGTFGTVGRNSLRGPDAVTFDTSVFKSIPLHDKYRLEFRMEAFNSLNHARFDNPDSGLTDPTFGAIQSANDPRVLQLALKLVF
jgi:hypothetical protein